MMVKQGTLTATPRLRFPEFRETSGWSAKILGDEGEFLSALTGKTAEHFGTGTAKYVTYMNVFANTFTDMAKLGIVDVGSGESQNAIEAGDVLFTVSSETPEEVGMSSVVIDAVPNCYVNSFCAMFRFADGGQPNLRFLGYSLRQSFARRHFVKRAQGSTRFNLSKDAFRSLPLALPSPAEQQKIADCLTSLVEVIAAQRRKVEALKAHKRGLMQQLSPREGETSPRLRFPEFANAPEWEEQFLGELVDLLSGYPFDGKDIVEDGAGERLMRGINITEGAVRHSAEMDRYYLGPIDGLEKYHLEKNDLVIGMDGSKVGRNSALIGEEDAGALLIQRVARLRADSVLLMEFIFQQIHSFRFHAYVDRINTSSGIPHISAKQIKEYPIHSTSEDEQNRIADFLSSLDTQITAESNQLTALKTHKQGLMQQLFPALEGIGA